MYFCNIMHTLTQITRRQIFTVFTLCFVLNNLFFSSPIYAQSPQVDFLREIIFTYDNNLTPSPEDLAKANTICKELSKTTPLSAQLAFTIGLYYAKQSTPNTHYIPSSSLTHTLKASENFEQSILIKPDFTDPNYLIDAYTKLASLWGNMAISYQLSNKPDSAIWAWVEGKKRGAFDEFILDYNRLLLDKCEANATLLVDGDNFYYPLRYLQEVSSYRTDVKIIQIDLLNTFWYPNYLQHYVFQEKILPATFFDSATYKPWTTKKMTLTNHKNYTFKWEVVPTYLDKYILRSDFLLLDYLLDDEFNTPINYIEGIAEDMLIGLPQIAIKNGPLRSIATTHLTNETMYAVGTYLKQFEKVATKADLQLHAHKLMIDHVRFITIKEINTFVILQQKELAKKLFSDLTAYLPIEKYPTDNEQLLAWQNQLSEVLN